MVKLIDKQMILANEVRDLNATDIIRELILVERKIILKVQMEQDC